MPTAASYTMTLTLEVNANEAEILDRIRHEIEEQVG